MGTFDTKKFKALHEKWSKKLEASGFEDIEDDKGTLKHTTCPKVIKRAINNKEDREIYYSIAREFLNNYSFFDDVEYKIWEAHCEGIGARTIAKSLKISTYKVEINIKKFKELAKLKKSKDEV